MEPTDSPVWSYPLRAADPASAGTEVGHLGGHPRGIPTDRWPRCAVCGNPMCHVGQLDAGAWLDLGAFRRMTLFICHATGGRCEDWHPTRGANRVLLHQEVDPDLYDGPPTVRVYRKARLVAEPPVDERAMVEAGRESGAPREVILASLRHDKLGGLAGWWGEDATPDSRAGEGKMRLVLQLTTQIVTLDITRRGVLFVFLDPHDRSPESAKMLWQSD